MMAAFGNDAGNGRARWAVADEAVGGRAHEDPFLDGRGALAIDRHRVLHSAAFRRLQYKTQVFLTNEGDHFRTRLTHTLEVAHVAGTLAVRLGLNRELAEVIALAHDLGHPPFGHAGELELNERMAGHGGFNHNAHSLRVVEELEHPFPPFRGLNLTLAVRAGLARHSSAYDRPGEHPLVDGCAGALEGQVASLADRIAYNGHDIEDALAAGVIGDSDLSGVSIWNEAVEGLGEAVSGLSVLAVRRPILDRMGAIIVDDVVACTLDAIKAAGIETTEDVAGYDGVLVGLSEHRRGQLEELEGMLLSRVYGHRIPVRMDAKGRRFVGALFEAYVGQPKLIPERFVRRVDEQGVERVVCDYVAGMTDRYCQDEYQRLFQPFERI